MVGETKYDCRSVEISTSFRHATFHINLRCFIMLIHLFSINLILKFSFIFRDHLHRIYKSDYH